MPKSVEDSNLSHYSKTPVTRTAISQITDEGLFESLAARVISLDNPLYRGLVETGTNPEGKTIPGLVDGIVFARDSGQRKWAIVAEHTTTSRTELRGKWLTSKNADVPKSIARLQQEMARDSSLQARIILTSNKDPDDVLVSDVEETARKAGIDVEFYTNSVIARVLDSSGEGQWIRHQILDLPLQRLSADLAREIANQMLRDAAPRLGEEKFVARNATSKLLIDINQKNGLRFVQGPSGVGKSVICHHICRQIMDGGGVAFVIPDSVLSKCSNLREAVLTCLKKYAPEIVETDIFETLSKMFSESKIVFWVEDINHASAPGREAEKLLRWTETSPKTSNGTSYSEYSILCPIWRQHVLGMAREAREKVNLRSVFVTPYSQQEGQRAVAERARLAGVELTALKAESIATQLGHDPLLIGVLTDWCDVDPSSVIGDYIEDCLQTDKNCTTTPGERRRALKQLACKLIRHRSLTPCADEMMSWSTYDGFRTAIRELLHQGKIISFSGPSTDERPSFRHDRIRDHLLVDAFVEMLSEFDAAKSLLADPYYSRFIGPALIRGRFSQEMFEKVSSVSLPAIFEALKYATAVGTDYLAVAELCEKKLKTLNWDEMPISVQYALHSALAETDAPQVLSLIALTPAPSFPAQFAQVRNGDVHASARLCFNFEPARQVYERDKLIAHAREKFGQKWMNELAALIVENPSDERYSVGALYLAGELGDPSLAPAIATRWRTEHNEGMPLSPAMLWAAVSCGLNDTDFPIDKIVDAWKTLPTKNPEKEHSNPRYDVADHALSGGLQRRSNDQILGFLATIGEQNEELRHPVCGCFQYINHPIAVEFLVSDVAFTDEKYGGPENHIAGHILCDYWAREDKYGGHLSSECRERLSTIWTDTTQTEYMRARAFQLWAARLSPGDASYLSDSPPQGLEDEALAARLRDGDQSSKPALKEKLRADIDSHYWWHFASKVGTNGLEEEIEIALDDRRATKSTDPTKNWLGDWCMAELLCDRDDTFALEVIKRHWDHLKSEAQYVQAMLYFSTPESIAMANAAIEAAEKPTDLLAHLDSHWGVNHVRRLGVKRVEQLEALRPYFDQLEWLVICGLWDACNRRGWVSWRRKYIDPVALKYPRLAAIIDKNAAFDSVDAEISSSRSLEFSVHCWVDERLRSSESISDILDLLEEYTNVRQTTEGAEFLGEAIREYGRRSDLRRLNFRWPKSTQEIEQMVHDVRFSVEHRSLS